MVEIITMGRLPEEHEYQKDCHHCKTRFKFKRKEARESEDQRDPGLYIDCPLCKTTLWVDYSSYLR